MNFIDRLSKFILISISLTASLSVKFH